MIHMIATFYPQTHHRRAFQLKCITMVILVKRLTFGPMWIVAEGHSHCHGDGYWEDTCIAMVMMAGARHANQ